MLSEGQVVAIYYNIYPLMWMYGFPQIIPSDILIFAPVEWWSDILSMFIIFYNSLNFKEGLEIDAFSAMEAMMFLNIMSNIRNPDDRAAAYAQIEGFYPMEAQQGGGKPDIFESLFNGKSAHMVGGNKEEIAKLKAQLEMLEKQEAAASGAPAAAASGAPSAAASAAPSLALTPVGSSANNSTGAAAASAAPSAAASPAPSLALTPVKRSAAAAAAAAAQPANGAANSLPLGLSDARRPILEELFPGDIEKQKEFATYTFEQLIMLKDKVYDLILPKELTDQNVTKTNQQLVLKAALPGGAYSLENVANALNEFEKSLRADFSIIDNERFKINISGPNIKSFENIKHKKAKDLSARGKGLVTFLLNLKTKLGNIEKSRTNLQQKAKEVRKASAKPIKTAVIVGCSLAAAAAAYYAWQNYGVVDVTTQQTAVAAVSATPSPTAAPNAAAALPAAAPSPTAAHLAASATPLATAAASAAPLATSASIWSLNGLTRWGKGLYRSAANKSANLFGTAAGFIAREVVQAVITTTSSAAQTAIPNIGGIAIAGAAAVGTYAVLTTATSCYEFNTEIKEVLEQNDKILENLYKLLLTSYYDNYKKDILNYIEHLRHFYNPETRARMFMESKGVSEHLDSTILKYLAELDTKGHADIYAALGDQYDEFKKELNSFKEIGMSKMKDEALKLQGQFDTMDAMARKGLMAPVNIFGKALSVATKGALLYATAGAGGMATLGGLIANGGCGLLTNTNQAVGLALTSSVEAAAAAGGAGARAERHESAGRRTALQDRPLAASNGKIVTFERQWQSLPEDKRASIMRKARAMIESAAAATSSAAPASSGAAAGTQFRIKNKGGGARIRRTVKNKRKARKNTRRYFKRK